MRWPKQLLPPVSYTIDSNYFLASIRNFPPRRNPPSYIRVIAPFAPYPLPFAPYPLPFALFNHSFVPSIHPSFEISHFIIAYERLIESSLLSLRRLSNNLSRTCQKRSVVKKSRRSNLLLQRHHQGYRNRNDANLCLSCSYRSSLSHIQNSRLKTSYNGFKSRLRVPCSIAPIAAPQRHKNACYALHKRLCDRYWL